MSAGLKVVSLEEQQLSVFGISREEVLKSASSEIVGEIQSGTVDGLPGMITLPFSVIKSLTGFTQNYLESLEHLDFGNRNKRMTISQLQEAILSKTVNRRKKETKEEKAARLRAELAQLEGGQS